MNNPVLSWFGIVRLGLVQTGLRDVERALFLPVAPDGGLVRGHPEGDPGMQERLIDSPVG